MTVKAIYEDGVFRPKEPVHIADRTPVEVILPEADPQERKNQEEIFSLLRKSYASGHTDTAARHNEHQP